MKKIFGARLRELRGTQKQAETAMKLGISVVRLSRLERGEYEPDLATIAAAAKYFRVTADYLLGLSDERNPANCATATATASATSDAARIVAEVARILAPAKAPEPPVLNAADLARRMDALENAVRTLAAAADRILALPPVAVKDALRALCGRVLVTRDKALRFPSDSAVEILRALPPADSAGFNIRALAPLLSALLKRDAGGLVRAAAALRA